MPSQAGCPPAFAGTGRSGMTFGYSARRGVGNRGSRMTIPLYPVIPTNAGIQSFWMVGATARPE